MTTVPLDAGDHAEVAARTRDRLEAFCKVSPHGFHLYDVTQAGKQLIECLECGQQRSEVAILGDLLAHEPPHGSVVMVEGPRGNAMQRMRNGSWRSTGGRSANWEAVLSRSRPGSRVWLIYVPPVDNPPPPRYTR